MRYRVPWKGFVLLLPHRRAFAAHSVEDAVPDLRAFLSNERDREETAQYLAQEVQRAFPEDPKLRSVALKNIAQNLADKQALPLRGGKSLTLTPDELKRTVIDCEPFKRKTYLSAGVFPKRYFGYFDEKWDTVKYERVLREITHAAVKLINEAQKKKGSPVRVSDIEIAVTFIAEGGALLLRKRQAQIDDVHPVYGVGLDDIATGLKLYQDLALQFDQAFSTELQQVVSWDADGRAALKRNMRFKEAIIGTALMCLYEKELAAQKLQQIDGTQLEQLSLDEQFVVASLVYNSGLIFRARVSRRGQRLLHSARTAPCLDPKFENQRPSPSRRLGASSGGDKYPIIRPAPLHEGVSTRAEVTDRKTAHEHRAPSPSCR
jgi:hypothetical protein